ncbi:translation machinery-associated protein 16 [Lactobacillus sp. XV13L]|nr:translation machinery-associated protein 16 [Lactobacillus sp. XV13L]
MHPSKSSRKSRIWSKATLRLKKLHRLQRQRKKQQKTDIKTCNYFHYHVVRALK